MNPSKTANPTTGVIEAGPINSLTRKTTISGITTSSNKHAIGFSNHKHTPITATHTRPRTLGASASNIATPQPEPTPDRTRTEPVFVLVRPGRNPVLRTMFPAGQRDITLDQTRSVVQLEPGPHACDNGHRRRPATTPARTPPSQPRA